MWNHASQSSSQRVSAGSGVARNVNWAPLLTRDKKTIHSQPLESSTRHAGSYFVPISTRPISIFFCRSYVKLLDTIVTGWIFFLYFRRPPEVWGPWHLPHLPHGWSGTVCVCVWVHAVCSMSVGQQWWARLAVGLSGSGGRWQNTSASVRPVAITRRPRTTTLMSTPARVRAIYTTYSLPPQCQR